MGFFTKNRVRKPNCIQCSLRAVKSPNMGYVGGGKKGILLIGSSPTTIDDHKGILRMHRLITKELLDRELNPLEDCWYTTAVQCTTYDEKSKKHKEPSAKQIQCCRNSLTGIIKDLQPSKILLMGDAALQMFYGERNSKCTSTYKMAGLKLWDSEFKAWVFPLWEPEFVQKKKYEKLLYSEFSRCFTKAIQHTSKPLNKQWSQIHKLTTFREALLALKACLGNDTCIAIDYETTGLTMYKEGHSTVSFAWANDRGAWALPVEHPHWTAKQQLRIVSLVRKILEKDTIKKIVAGINFEYPWTKQQMKVTPRGFFWDTQLATHVLDSRTGITGLKFQCFMRWGIGDYDALSSKFIKSTPGSEFNSMLKMPVEALLEYNAKDALYTYELYKEQLGEFEGNEIKAYQFMHKGATAMCEMSHNGIQINEEFYLQQKAVLEGERDALISKINSSKEVKRYSRRTGSSFDYNSPKDLQEMLFKVLKLKSIKETKTGHSVDEEVLTKINIPLTSDILAVRKLNKMISTYIDGFLRRSDDGIMHPVFTLSRARSFRSCIAKGELVHTTNGHKEIDKVVAGDIVHCFDDSMNPTTQKVLWSGCTGYKKVLNLQIQKDNGDVVLLRCTPEHRVRLKDGSYKRADSLLPTDDIAEEI